MGEKQAQMDSFLKISTSPFFTNFLHECCDEIIEGKPITFKNYTNDDIELSIEDIEQAELTVKDHICKFIIHGMSEKSELVSEAASDVLEKCLETRRNDLENHLIKTAFDEAGHNLLENVDYKLKWILGNSSFPGYREIILQLHLGCSRNIVDIELNIEKLDYIINAFENVFKEFSHIIN